MPTDKKSKAARDADRDAVLKTMLKTPPKPHKDEPRRAVARGKPKRDA